MFSKIFAQKIIQPFRNQYVEFKNLDTAVTDDIFQSKGVKTMSN